MKKLMIAALVLLGGCATTHAQSGSMNVNLVQPNYLYLQGAFPMTTGSIPTPGAPNNYRYGPIYTP